MIRQRMEGSTRKYLRDLQGLGLEISNKYSNLERESGSWRACSSSVCGDIDK